MSNLKKTLSWKELLSIGIGAVVGWSWIIYAGMWSSLGGSLGGIIAFIVTGLLCSLVGLVYAELTAAYPKAGGEVVFAHEAFGEKSSILAQWLGMLLWLGLIMVETMMFPVILASLGFGIPQAGFLYEIGGHGVYLSYIAISVGFNLLFALINILGAKISGTVQKFAVYILLAAAVFFFGSGIIKGDVSNAQPLFTDFSSLSYVLLMLPGFMSGFNAIPQTAEEGLVPHKILGRMVIATVWASVIFYVLIVVGLSFAAPAEVRSGQGLVVVDAVNLIFNNSPVTKLIVTFASLLGMLTSWNAAYLAGSRLLTGLGRSKLLPPMFNAVHKKYGTPAKAVLFLFIFSSLIVFLGTNQAVYVGLVNGLSFGVVLQWLLVSICFIRLRKTKPDLSRPYKVSQHKLVGWLSVAACIWFIWLYTPLGPAGLTVPEWIFLAGYAAFALIVYLLWNKRGGKMTADERRKLMGVSYDKSDAPADTQ